MPTPARIFLLIGLAALLTTLLCSVTVHVRESRHTGEPLPQKTLAEITAAPHLMPPFLHVQDATVDFSSTWVDDHFCYRTHCIDTFNPLVSPGGSDRTRVAVVSMIETLPGDVNEKRHPFDPHDPIVEGQVQPTGLSDDVVADMRAHGILADDRTVVLQRFAYHGRIPGPNVVDELLPFLLGLPITLVTGLIGLRLMIIARQAPASRPKKRARAGRRF